jgi:hypothetical protein
MEMFGPAYNFEGEIIYGEQAWTFSGERGNHSLTIHPHELLLHLKKRVMCVSNMPLNVLSAK